MIVGITYDLKDDYLKAGFSDEEAGEFDRPDTIEAIDNTLQLLGYKTEKIGNVKQLVKYLSEGKRWDMVFNICEGMYGIGREAQVPALLEAYNIPFTFSDSLVLALTLHKGMTKRVIRDCGIPTADFCVINEAEDLNDVRLPYPLFAKPVAEGTGKGIDNASRINDKAQLKTVCLNILEKFRQPVLVETYLPGREFTVGITGTGTKAEAIGVLEVVLNDRAFENTYSYLNKERCDEFVEYFLAEGEIAESCKKVALDSWRSLNCRDGGRVDLKLDKNNVPNFLEVNPLAGIHPVHSDLPILATKAGISYMEIIRRIMNSALERYREKFVMTN
jgi:D-alanine-D-alanine ligase